MNPATPALRTSARGASLHADQESCRHSIIRDHAEKPVPEPAEVSGGNGDGGRGGWRPEWVCAKWLRLRQRGAEANAKIDGIQKSPFSTNEAITPYKDVTNYNNYYEFSTDKYGPAGLAKNFRTRPWTVTIDGQVKKKQVLDVDTIIKMAAPEERIYRHRCVEGWSIVVPWVGFSLSELIKRADPLPKAKFVEFTTLF